MTQVTIEKVFTKVKETKFGEKLSVGLKIKESSVEDLNGAAVQVNDRYLNGWFNKDYKFPYKEGDEVDIIITTRGDWLDFQLPEVAAMKKGGDPTIGPRVTKLEKQMAQVLAKLAVDAGEEPDDPDDY